MPPAAPLWRRELDDERAQFEIDHLGSAAMATDWGARIISERSRLYDPLSYHYGSVWPLFTGWASVAAYAYGRPHVGYQALMANVGLTYTNALGYVTELLSGAFDAPFGRSSHHQVWSEAMVATAALRGLLGIEIRDGGRSLRFAPQLPADWDHAAVSGVAAGDARYDLTMERSGERFGERSGSGGLVKESISVSRRDRDPSGSAGVVARIIITSAFPLDTKIKSVLVNGRAVKFSPVRTGDVERVEVATESPEPKVEARFEYIEGTDVYTYHEPLQPGAASEGLRIIRSRADQNTLRLTLQGVGGR